MSLLMNRSREVRDIVYEIDFDNNEDRYLQDKETMKSIFARRIKSITAQRLPTWIRCLGI